MSNNLRWTPPGTPIATESSADASPAWNRPDGWPVPQLINAATVALLVIVAVFSKTKLYDEFWFAFCFAFWNPIAWATLVVVCGNGRAQTKATLLLGAFSGLCLVVADLFAASRDSSHSDLPYLFTAYSGVLGGLVVSAFVYRLLSLRIGHVHDAPEAIESRTTWSGFTRQLFGGAFVLGSVAIGYCLLSYELVDSYFGRIATFALVGVFLFSVHGGMALAFVSPAWSVASIALGGAWMIFESWVGGRISILGPLPILVGLFALPLTLFGFRVRTRRATARVPEKPAG